MVVDNAFENYEIEALIEERGKGKKYDKRDVFTFGIIKKDGFWHSLDGSGKKFGATAPVMSYAQAVAMNIKIYDTKDDDSDS